MKKFIVMMLVVLASITNLMASTNINYEYNGVNIIEHVIDDKNFNIIKVGFPFIITIKENDTFGINIRTNEEYLSDKIKYVIKDSTLVIWVENINYEEIRNFEEKNIRITIMAPNTKLKINTLNDDLRVVFKKSKNTRFAINENN